MSRFMKMLNNISRSQAIYRSERVAAEDLSAGHYAFVFAICRAPGRSQEELARELCVNKSTVARALNHLENAGYVTRVAAPSDKRQLTVYPTEKMTAVLPLVKAVSAEWMALLSEGISEEELAVFDAVLERMQARAAEIVAEMEEERA